MILLVIERRSRFGALIISLSTFEEKLSSVFTIKVNLFSIEDVMTKLEQSNMSLQTNRLAQGKQKRASRSCCFQDIAVKHEESSHSRKTCSKGWNFDKKKTELSLRTSSVLEV